MRYKLPNPKGLPDAEGLARLAARVDAHRRTRGVRPDYAGPDRKQVLADLLALGTAYHFRGLDEKAIEVLEELVANRGKHGAFQYLAVSYERLCRYDEAIGAHRRAIERAPTDPFHLGHLGRLLCLMGRDKEAMAVLKAAQKAAPYDFHVRARLASVRSRLRPDDLDEAVRRPTYCIVVVLGDRANFGDCQTLLESLYRRTHRLVLVVDIDGPERGGDAGLAMKAWMKRHPGVELANHAPIHARRLAGLSRLTGRAYARTDRWPWVATVGDALRSWTLKLAADLMLVCLDRTEPMFGEPYVRAADDAGYLVCGLGASGDPTPLERHLGRAIPRLLWVVDGVPTDSEVVTRTGNAVLVRGDPALERLHRPAPEKSDLLLFDELFPTLVGRAFVLYLADPARPPIDELVQAGSLASRLRQADRTALRRLTVVYRSAMPARFPIQHPMPDNLVLWPRPDSSQDANTPAILRVGIRRALAAVSHAAGEVVPCVLVDRPAIVLQTDGGRAQADTRYGEGMYRCGSLGEVVHLLGDIVGHVDPLAPARSALAAGTDLARLCRFDSIGGLLCHGVELLAGGEPLDRVSSLLASEFDGPRERASGDGSASGPERGWRRWIEAADQALATAGCAFRVASEFRHSQGRIRPDVLPDLDAAAALLRGLEGCGLIGHLAGPSSGKLAAQLLGGPDGPETQLQSALLLKAAFPDLTVYLIDAEDRFDELARTLYGVFPEARVADAVEGRPPDRIRAYDFVYTLDKRIRDFEAFVPSVAIAQSGLCRLPAERALAAASRLVEWPVPFLVLSVDTEPRRAARNGSVLAALQRSFRVLEPDDATAGQHRAVVAASRPAVIRLRSGAANAVELPRLLASPSVTIGLVVYNGAEGLREALDSILSQTYWDFEVIVVDNGSTDSTLEIARSYADRDSRVIIYPRRKNVGAVGNFRFALSLATGRYFCWASDHDVYDRVWLERMVRALDGRPDAVLAYPYFGMIDDRGARVGDHLVRFDTSGRDIAHRMRLVTDRMRGSGSKVYGLYRRAALDRVRVRTAVWWDRLFLLELAAVGEFVQVCEVLWWRRYKGVLRQQILPPEAGKFGSIPPSLSTKDTVIRQLEISFEDGRPPFLMRMATLANAVLFLVDLVFAPPGRRGMDLGMLPLALRSAFRAVVRTKAFVPAEFRALREYLTGR